MLTGTLLFPIGDIPVKRIVLSISYQTSFLIKTVRALLVGTMMTFRLCWGNRSYLADAFGATSRRGMIALTMRLLFCSLSPLLTILSTDRTRHAVDTFLGRNMVTTRSLA